MNTKTTVISQEQLQQQFAFCHKIRQYLLHKTRIPTPYVVSYGCQQTAAASQQLR